MICRDTGFLNTCPWVLTNGEGPFGNQTLELLVEPKNAHVCLAEWNTLKREQAGARG